MSVKETIRVKMVVTSTKTDKDMENIAFKAEKSDLLQKGHAGLTLYDNGLKDVFNKGDEVYMDITFCKEHE